MRRTRRHNVILKGKESGVIAVYGKVLDNFV